MTIVAKPTVLFDRGWLLLAAPAPAAGLGILAMRASGVEAGVWKLQLAVWGVLSLALAGWLLFRPRITARGAWFALAAGVAGILATFADPGLQGVHRYFHVGGFRLNAGEMFLPGMVAVLWVLRSELGRWAFVVAMIVMGLLVLQPDAGRASAFAAASAVMLVATSGRMWRVVWILVLATAVGMAWMRADPLGRVPHVEGIVEMAGSVSPFYGICAWASILLLPAPFILVALRERKGIHLGLAAYFAVSAVMPFLGNFPVAVLGFGASGMIGYCAGLAALVSMDREGEV